jgi:hypothetical protein
MNVISTKNSIRLILVFWLVLWVNFIARDFYKKGYARDYSVLARSDARGKHAHTYGERLFALLEYAKGHLPDEARYALVGIKEFSLDSRRAIYYLYPHRKAEHPEYLIVFDRPGFTEAGYRLFAQLDTERFILERE